MNIGDLFEGVVSRRGNKLQVGSLELQLYPDHIFYVVSGGKGADLSIYKDGAFKPPRNNEIYLKDAASRGVPQAFINLFAKFFATNDVDVVVNGLEQLFNKHVKENVDEALLSPRVHEIFLKGLVGAILSGGLSLGIDYAKEKTADYDRQGLQSVYKSIDPREYPQLTKKLTPQDRKGLDAILGKLKEHAMRMEDLSEEDKRMSRAGKGVMKYGKDGMKALAKAGRDGASEEKLDKIRDKYDNYEESLEEKWSQKYKDSINCSNPKGFSQKAHCAGKKKNEDSLDEGPRGMGVAARDWAQNKKSQASRRGDAGWSKPYRQPGEPSKADLSAMAAKAKADYDKKKGIREEEDHEASMAKGQLYNACKNAMALMKMIQDGENLEGWVAAKITKAADYLNMVHDYMAYEEVSEEKQRLDPKCWTGYRKQGTKMKGGVRVNNCVKVKK